MNTELRMRVGAALTRDIHPAIADYACFLGEEARADAVLFYGSNLRSGTLGGVIDFYVLLPGPPEKGMWPRVSYREWTHEGDTLRAKIATMTLAKFAEAARGDTVDTTIWARFVQPSAIAWARDDSARDRLVDAMEQAARTAACLAVAVGPERGTEDDYWRALFAATYRAELRVEKPGREDTIVQTNAAHFDGLLKAALLAENIGFARDGRMLRPILPPVVRRAILRWWNRRRRLGKPLNVARLLRATRTFDGAGRYGAWKVERHTGVKVKVTPWRERHPVLSAPGVLWQVWRAKRRD